MVLCPVVNWRGCINAAYLVEIGKIGIQLKAVLIRDKPVQANAASAGIGVIPAKIGVYIVHCSCISTQPVESQVKTKDLAGNAQIYASGSATAYIHRLADLAAEAVRSSFGTDVAVA